MKTILVTGATGTIGGAVLKALVGKPNVNIRAAVRDPAKARLPAGVEAVELDWDAPKTYAGAVRGADSVFLLTPFVDTAVDYTRALVEAAKAAGTVKKIVKLSATGVSADGFQLSRWHYEAERIVEGSGLAWVALRPNFFMSNFVAFYPPDAEGVMYLPTGDGKAAWVDPADIGAVAAQTLLRSDWDGKTLEISGPEALSIGQVAAILTEVTGRPIKHVDVPEADARKALAGFNMPGWMVDGMMDLHTIIKNNWAAATSSVVEEITGDKPRTLRSFAQENKASFAKK